MSTGNEGSSRIHIDGAAEPADPIITSTGEVIPEHEMEMIPVRGPVVPTIGGGNLQRNGSFESDDGIWWGAGWSRFTTDAAVHGSSVARCVPVIGDVPGELSLPRVDIDPTLGYWLSVHCWLPIFASGAAEVLVREFDDTDAFIRETVLARVDAQLPVWSRLSKRYGQYARTADEDSWGATTAGIRLVFRTTGEADFTWNVDAVQVEQGDLTAYRPFPGENLLGENLITPVPKTLIDETPPDNVMEMHYASFATVAPDGTVYTSLRVTAADQPVDADWYGVEVELSNVFTGVGGAADVDWTGALARFISASAPFTTVFESLVGGTRYYVRWRTLDGVGNRSTWHSGDWLDMDTLVGAPSIPGGLFAIPGFQGVGLHWNASPSPNIDHYEYRYRLSAGPGAWVAPLSIKGTTKFISPLTATESPATSYDFAVRAVDTLGQVVLSDTDATIALAATDLTAGWSASVTTAPLLVGTPDIAAHSIVTDLIAAGAVTATEIDTTGLVVHALDNVGSTVTIDSGGITVRNGVINLQDASGATVLNASGFGPSWRGFVQTGIVNGYFAEGPPTPGAPINNTTNKLPGWEWVDGAAGALVPTWSGGVITITGTSVAPTARSYFRQSVDVELGELAWGAIAYAASTNPTNGKAVVRVPNAGSSDGYPLTTTPSYASVPAPATAPFGYIEIGALNDTGAPLSFTTHHYSVMLSRHVEFVNIRSNDPATYPNSANIYKQAGALLASSGETASGQLQLLANNAILSAGLGEIIASAGGVSFGADTAAGAFVTSEAFVLGHKGLSTLAVSGHDPTDADFTPSPNSLSFDGALAVRTDAPGFFYRVTSAGPTVTYYRVANVADVAAGYQPLDSDLTAIAALTPTNDDVIQRKAGAWANRTIAQLLVDLAAPATTFQPLDSDLTAIAALATTSFGRGLLTQANGPAALATIGAVALGGDTMTGPLVLSADPSVGLGAATKQYVDSVATGLDVKPSVRVATSAQTTLSGTATIDGVATSVGDRILVRAQTAPAENGIYVRAAGAWTRATDMDAWAEVPGAFVFVEDGTVYADTGWVATSNAGGTLGTTAITWSQFAGVGSYSASGGITLTGTNFTRDALTGDVTAPAGSNVTTLAAGSAGALNSGTLLAARMPALTGDVTTSAGAVATTIAAGAVTLAKQANLAQDQFIGRVTASTGVPETATITAAARTVLDDTTVGAMVDTLGGASATGTGGLVRKTNAALVTPDLGTPSALVGTNISGTAASLTAGTVTTNANLTGDVTSSGNATTIGAGKVTLAMMANIATARLIGRATAATGVPEALTLGTGLEFSGTALQRSAQTGDVTSPAGSNVTTLAAGNAGNLNAGTLLAARMPALTGVVTTSAGGVATSFAASPVFTGTTQAPLFAMTGIVFPAAITANQADWNPGATGGLVYATSTGGVWNLSGIVAPSIGDGMFMWLHNNGSNNLILTHNDVASTAANRFFAGGGANVTLRPSGSVLIVYTQTRWRITGP